MQLFFLFGGVTLCVACTHTRVPGNEMPPCVTIALWPVPRMTGGRGWALPPPPPLPPPLPPSSQLQNSHTVLPTPTEAAYGNMPSRPCHRGGCDAWAYHRAAAQPMQGPTSAVAAVSASTATGGCAVNATSAECGGASICERTGGSAADGPMQGANCNANVPYTLTQPAYV